MGDKPINEPNTEECPFGPYPNGRHPSKIFATCYGFDMNPMHPPTQVPPYNGFVQLDFVTCLSFKGSVPNWEFFCFVEADRFDFQIRLTESVWVYKGEYEYPLLENISIPMTWLVFPYTAGSVIVQTNLYDSGLPASWAPASLIGVPKQEGYFAEQGYSGLDAKHYRYANEANGTNIKLILE
jgi:hypothetical protein